ncbi:MAG: 16S rRNA (guanine(966)-N(2))-methyltransferase RsmD [Acidobacteriota bacterium]|nr:16S rRNA (guanine(966)-N(2))-methyltransferase RsmD [Acidobacteriota bacterium]
MRITGGQYRGRRLRVPSAIRPTSAKVREALFSMWGARILDSRFLDLFAGAGTVGLEALSRGAREVVLFERRGRGFADLERNCAQLAESGWKVEAGVLPRDLARMPSQEKFQFVFADPPYDFVEYDELLAAIGPLVAVNGDVAIEHSSRCRVADSSRSFLEADSRRYGESRLTVFRLRKRQEEPLSGGL